MISKIIAFVSFLTFCCSSEAQLQNTKLTSFGTFKYSERESKTIVDLIQVCQEKLPNISKILDIKIDQNIIIEVYSDQAAFDQNIMNPELKGSPAISGNGRIQLVSPLAKIRIDTISYKNRLMFLTHEFIHIFLDQLENPIPIFLDEGLACYYGSYDYYSSITQKFKNYVTNKPSINQLFSSYGKIPAADVYSFIFIDFLTKTESQDKISEIIRNPEILKSKNSDWIKFLTDYQK